MLSANEIFFGEKYEEKIFMFPHVMTLVGSYSHQAVGQQAAGRPICCIEYAFAFALSRDLHLHFSRDENVTKRFALNVIKCLDLDILRTWA